MSARDDCRYWGRHHVWGVIWRSWRGNVERCACGKTRRAGAAA